MARPKTITFFEKDLSPVLSESEQWLSDYHFYSRMLVEYLIAHGAKHNAYHTAVNCLSKLRGYLLQNGRNYSDEEAILWFETTAKHVKGYKATLSRLSDLYCYGEIQPVNAFPHALAYEKFLKGSWKKILAQFIDSLTNTKSHKESVKNCVSRFLYRIQEIGITSPDEITYELLESYCQTDGHASDQSYSRYIHAIESFLLFLSDQDLCSPGISWFLHFRLQGNVFRVDDLANEQKELLLQSKNQETILTLKEYAETIPEFIRDYDVRGYSEGQCYVVRHTLYNLLLFMEMYDLEYNRTSAEIWLECKKKSLGDGLSWKAHRRVLNLFHEYIDRKSVASELVFREKPLLCEKLPLWCREELDSYMSLKQKEGWARSTLDMIRSSLTRFCSFLTEYGLESFTFLTPEILKDFNIRDPHKTPEGKNAYNGRIRRFLRYLERKEIIPYGLHLALPGNAASSEKNVIVLTKDEKHEIKEKLDSCLSPIDFRDKVVMLIGIKMGLRASDIVTINIEDIDWEKQTLRLIQEKTDHEILLPIPTEVANAIYLYIKKGRPNGRTAEKNLLLKARAPYNSLTRNVCTDALERTLPERDVPGSGFHVTRKTYATDRLRNGTGKQILADLLGHKDTSSLNHYLLLDEERMRMCPITLSEAGLLLEGGRYENK